VISSKSHHLSATYLIDSLFRAGIPAVRVYQHGIKEKIDQFYSDSDNSFFSVLRHGWDVLVDIGATLETHGIIPLFKFPDRLGFSGTFSKVIILEEKPMSCLDF
jgi:hypothetical protein